MPWIRGHGGGPVRLNALSPQKSACPLSEGCASGCHLAKGSLGGMMHPCRAVRAGTMTSLRFKGGVRWLSRQIM